MNLKSIKPKLKIENKDVKLCKERGRGQVVKRRREARKNKSEPLKSE